MLSSKHLLHGQRVEEASLDASHQDALLTSAWRPFAESPLTCHVLTEYDLEAPNGCVLLDRSTLEFFFFMKNGASQNSNLDQYVIHGGHHIQLAVGLQALQWQRSPCRMFIVEVHNNVVEILFVLLHHRYEQRNLHQWHYHRDDGPNEKHTHCAYLCLVLKSAKAAPLCTRELDGFANAGQPCVTQQADKTHMPSDGPHSAY